MFTGNFRFEKEINCTFVLLVISKNCKIMHKSINFESLQYLQIYLMRFKSDKHEYWMPTPVGFLSQCLYLSIMKRKDVSISIEDCSSP